MKEIKVIIETFIPDSVLERLAAVDQLPVLTVSSIQVHSLIYPGCESLEQTKLEIVVRDEIVEPVIQAIQVGVRRGHCSDGRMFLTATEEIVNIRSGERWTHRTTM